MNTSQKLGKRIKIERIMRDWTMEQLAEKSGLGTTTIANTENGYTSPTLDTIEKLSNGFGIKLTDLLNFDGLEKFNQQ